MKTWLNIAGGFMILWPIAFCFYGASREGDLLEGFRCAGVIASAWLILSCYTAAAIWLVLQ